MLLHRVCSVDGIVKDMLDGRDGRNLIIEDGLSGQERDPIGVPVVHGQIFKAHTLLESPRATPVVHVKVTLNIESSVEVVVTLLVIHL